VTDQAKQRDLPSEILDILRCPACGSELRQQRDGLACGKCEAAFPTLAGVTRFVEKHNYAGSFGFQWHRHAQTQLDNASDTESENAFRQRTGFTPDELRGKLVLDVGCGMGRFAEVASRWGARVVGVDLSTAAEVAAENLADRNGCAFFQADAFALPFASESFDFIYSIGVLHHTPDCEKAFKGLAKFLKPGGTVAVWLYSRYNKWYRFSDIYRKFTHRLPRKMLHSICYMAVPKYHVYRGLRSIPLVGRPISGLMQHVFPTSLHPNPKVRVLDTFDWYSPKYQSKHTYEEVFRWFESCGLESLRVLHEPIAISGRKPVKGAETDGVENFSESRSFA
jgi:ubiquinone/menaquinone biosynthesis C-methylase UbiE